MQLIAHHQEPTLATGLNDPKVSIQVPNDTDIDALDLAGVQRVDLVFPKFTEGRAYSQAVMLRRRRSFAGDIRATGEVLVDQLEQMQRTGFSSAVLAAGQDIETGQRLLRHFSGHYQGDACTPQPRFARVLGERGGRRFAAGPSQGESAPSGGSELHAVSERGGQQS